MAEELINLIKGEPDWHKKINSNNASLNESLANIGNIINLYNEDITTLNSDLTQTNAKLENKVDMSIGDNLPLSSGYTAFSHTFYRKFDNVVFVNLAISKTSGVIQMTDIVATLPIGFRPNMRSNAPAALGISGWGSGVIGYLNIDTSGTISINILNNSNITSFVANIVYVTQ